MTLSVDEVRNIRFPMARQPNEDGYRASAVDNFIDRLEVSYAQIVDENERLRQAAAEGGGDAQLRMDRDRLAAELNELRSRGDSGGIQVAALEAQKAELQTRVNELNRLNSELTTRLESAGGGEQAAALQSEIDQLKTQLEASGAEVGRLNEELNRAMSEGGQSQALSDQLQQTGAENTRLRSEAARLRAQVEELTTRLNAEGADGDGTTKNLVVTTSADAAPAAILLVEQAIAQAETLMSNAESEAQKRRDEATAEARNLVEMATQQSEEISRRAQTESDQLTYEARQSAERITSEAQARATRVDAEAADRRRELLSQLEHDRDVLSERVGQLRDFEAQYRASMAAHLQRQIDSLNDAEFAPSYRPELLDGGKGATGTPRLNALIAEDAG